MAAKPEPRKKSVEARPSADSAEKDRRIADLENRISALENELRSRQRGPLLPGIAGHRRADEALPAGGGMYRPLAETSPNAIIVHQNGRFLYANPAALRLYGAGTFEQLRMYNVFDLLPAEDRELSFARINQPESGERIPHREAGLIRLDGQRVSVEAYASEVEYDDGKAIQVIIRGISERKLAEEKACESEVRMRALVDSIPDEVWFADTNRVVTLVNPAVFKEFGNVAEGNSVENIVASLDVLRADGSPRPAEETPLLRALNGETLRNLEEFIRTPASGELRFRQVNASPVKDACGNVIGSVAVVRDITEHNRSEEALRESGERERQRAEELETLMDIIPAAIWVSRDPDCKNITGNRVANRFYEAESGENVSAGPTTGGGQDLTRRFFQNGKEMKPEELPMQVSVAKGADVVNSEIDVLLPSGRTRVMMGNASPLRNADGQVRGSVSAFIDITERKRAEEALRNSEASLARAQTIAHLASWEVDVSTNRVRGSEELYRMFNLDPDVPLDDYIEKFHPDDRARVVEAINAAIYDGKPYSTDYRIIPRPGEIRHVHAEGETTFDRTGLPISFFGTVHDISERMRTEEELNEARIQAELYLDLMGHDINNMHQIALGYMELAREMIPHADDSRTEFLDKPIEVLHRSAQLIQNVRKLQKLKDGMFQTQEIDLCGTLVDVQREFGSVHDKVINLNINGCDHCHIIANELLHDVFSNLVSNAIKHTGDKADINIGLDVVNGNGQQYCRVNVEDNGPGISDDFKGIIFNRMIKGSSKAKGMGLGLYLVKTLVDSYNGHVWVEDRVPGDHTRGARFVVMLPTVDN